VSTPVENHEQLLIEMSPSDLGALVLGMIHDGRMDEEDLGNLLRGSEDLVAKLMLSADRPLIRVESMAFLRIKETTDRQLRAIIGNQHNAFPSETGCPSCQTWYHRNKFIGKLVAYLERDGIYENCLPELRWFHGSD
jgi:hypothetical protein